ncbi:diguanylate cyclase [Maridesulfovibrio salexigens]|uniref:Diguanylate cyclase with PAS/PAC sensor n=1 Tax=Maridesulfovibrio salexigens (strain ATCC 14822 / DSM 2638 / NCIMB 8403 / VKM B-1763) TaxID=526222 RepID=C6BVV0_MARSD|nr:diguanylate cyclase [Maridesulfovibrio salexigens]ACS80153.1 diguanylate cyclase with PAS/PAC sensor [Maridesulfovibrio salexigens DSM 2638]
MIKRVLPRIAIILIFILALDFFLIGQLSREQMNDQRVEVSLQLAALRARLEKEITKNLLLVQGTANYIAIAPDQSQEKFARYAKEALSGENLLKNLGAAPDFVMRFVYPLEGNLKIVGMDYRKLPNQWKQAKRVKETGEMVIAGPLDLFQGGTGLIGRAPVFVESDKGKKFWGIVSAVIDVDKLFKVVDISDTGLDIAIRGVDGLGEEGDVFLGPPQLFTTPKAVRMPVTFPSGSWVLVAMPHGGWTHSHPLAFIVHTLLGLLLAATSFGVYRSAKRDFAIQAIQQNLNQAQSIAHLGSWRLDHINEEIWWSDETYRIFGVDKNTFVPTLERFLDMVHPDDMQKFLDAFQSSTDSCSEYEVNHRIIRPSGEIRHVQERGGTVCLLSGKTPTHAMGTVLDVTERALAEEELRASEEKMRAMSESSYDAVIVVDVNDVISFWNSAAEKMFGWKAEEVIGKQLHQLISPKEYHHQVTKGMKDFAQTGQGPLIGRVKEMPAVRRNGEVFLAERSVTSFKLGDSYLAVGSVRDITERKRLEQELRHYANRLTLASKAGGIGVWEWNLRTNDLKWDDQMFRLYGLESGEFDGIYEIWKSRVHPDDLYNVEQSLQIATEHTGFWESEFRVIWPSNQVRCIKAAALIEKNADGKPELLIGVNWDVTESREKENQLRRMATTDDMTKLNNRRYFIELVKSEIERSIRYSRPLSLVMFDVDKFKAVNDTYGHDVGDMVLKAIAATAKGVLRDVDIIGRLGGEEFAVGLPETDLKGAMLLAERLRVVLEEASVELPDGGIVDFTVSLGVAVLDRSITDVDVLLKHADLALYAAKENGRNRVEAYTQMMD